MLIDRTRLDAVWHGDVTVAPLGQGPLRAWCDQPVGDHREYGIGEGLGATIGTDLGEPRVEPELVPQRVRGGDRPDRRRIDYLFTGWPRRGGIGSAICAELIGTEAIDGIVPSDHYGIVATLRY